MTLPALVWLLLATIWGSTWLFIKVGLQDLPPFWFAAIRFVVAAAPLVAWLVARRRPLRHSAGDWRLMAVTGLLTFTVNYALVFWGELHGHTGLEDAIGSAPRYYEYARDVAFLDFRSLSGHDIALSKAAWDIIRRETAAANRPGGFVAYMGYDWTVNAEFGGHHNVFFRNDPGAMPHFVRPRCSAGASGARARPGCGCPRAGASWPPT